MISGSGSALLDPTNLQALVDGCTDQEFRVQYKDEKKVQHQSHKSQKREKETQKVVFEVLVGDWCGNAIYNLVLLSISASRLSLSISSQQCFASFLSCKVISFHLYRSPNTDQRHDNFGIRASDLGLFDHYHETKMRKYQDDQTQISGRLPVGPSLPRPRLPCTPASAWPHVQVLIIPILVSSSLSLPLHWFGRLIDY